MARFSRDLMCLQSMQVLSRSAAILRNARAFGLCVAVVSLFLILTFDMKLTITDDNTSIRGSAYDFSLQSREDRPTMSVDGLNTGNHRTFRIAKSMLVRVEVRSKLDDNRAIGNKTLLAEFLDRFNWDAVQPCKADVRTIAIDDCCRSLNNCVHRRISLAVAERYIQQ